MNDIGGKTNQTVTGLHVVVVVVVVEVEVGVEVEVDDDEEKALLSYFSRML